MARVAIVIVTHQSTEVVGSCLDSIARLPDVETIVVDNASLDSTCEEVRRRNVRLIANPGNEGFAAAVNQGVRASEAPLILLVNPDLRLETDIDGLVDCFADPGVGAAGGLLIGKDGRPQAGFMARNLPTPAALIFEILGVNRLWPGNPANWHYRCLGKDPMVGFCAEQPAGAFFMFRRSVWQRLNGFDEGFWPVWFEDVDFCARLRAGGLFGRYCPDSRAIHQGGHSVGALSLEIREKYWYGSLLKYAAKHYSWLDFSVVCLSVAAGAAGRAVCSFPRHGLRVFPVYGGVIRLALARFLGAGSPDLRGRV